MTCKMKSEGSDWLYMACKLKSEGSDWLYMACKMESEGSETYLHGVLAEIRGVGNLITWRVS